MLQAGTEPGREDKHLLIGIVGFVYLYTRFFGLCPVFVDGEEYRFERFNVHEQVVDKKFYFPVVEMSEESDKGNAVEGSQRVIRSKDETAFGGNVFDAYHVGVNIHVVKQVVGKFYAGAILVCIEYVVDFVLMNIPFELTKKKTRNFVGVLRGFGLNDFFYVDF